MSYYDATKLKVGAELAEANMTPEEWGKTEFGEMRSFLTAYRSSTFLKSWNALERW
jgi:hypothetical protein